MLRRSLAVLIIVTIALHDTDLHGLSLASAGVGMKFMQLIPAIIFTLEDLVFEA